MSIPDGVNGRSLFSLCQCVIGKINLWLVGARDHDTSYSVEDRKVLELWNKEVTHDNGHYSLPIPCGDGSISLPDNRFLAECGLNSLVNYVDRTNVRDRYSQAIDKMVKQGYVEPVPNYEINLWGGPVWYLPHHRVLNRQGMRVYFNCTT